MQIFARIWELYSAANGIADLPDSQRERIRKAFYEGGSQSLMAFELTTSEEFQGIVFELAENHLAEVAKQAGRVH